jgi:hypothetical protein
MDGLKLDSITLQWIPLKIEGLSHLAMDSIKIGRILVGAQSPCNGFHQN